MHLVISGAGSNDWMVGGVLSWHHLQQSLYTIPQTSVALVIYVTLNISNVKHLFTPQVVKGQQSVINLRVGG